MIRGRGGAEDSGREITRAPRSIGASKGVSWSLVLMSMLSDHRVPFVCSGGTLLGILRDGALIPWDDDLDFDVPREWILSEAFIELTEFLSANGFEVRTKGFPLFPSASFFENGYKASVGSKLRIGPWKLKIPTRVPCSLLPDSDFLSPRYAFAHGQKWPIPHRAEELLEHCYGNWQVAEKWSNPSLGDYNRRYVNPRPVRAILRVLALVGSMFHPRER